jgi:thiol:disulfide interchange protein DsbA
MRRIASAVAGLMLILTTAASAQPEAGSDYRVLSEPQPTDGDKIEVIEFFSYGCPHCNDFRPIIDEWKSNAADNVEVSHVPVTFGRDQWKLMARAYYVADSLGVTDKTHPAVFKAIHVNRQRFSQPEQIAKLYASVGVDREDVMDAFDSFVVDMKVKRAEKMVRKYGVQRTPSMAVDGRFVTDPSTAGGQQEMLNVVEYLIDERVGD